MTIASTSRHLQVLFKAGAIRSAENKAIFVVYAEFFHLKWQELASSLKTSWCGTFGKMQADLAKKTGEFDDHVKTC